jgi:hypothetical protein
MFKIQNASRKDFESDEKNGWGVKKQRWYRGDQIGLSALVRMNAAAPIDELTVTSSWCLNCVGCNRFGR